MKKIKYPRLSFEQIEKVIVGDAEAMTVLVTLYMPYIRTLSHGNKEIEDRVIAKLMRAVLQFKLDYEGNCPRNGKTPSTGRVIAKLAPKTAQ